jgi:hypothetical protein
MTGLLSAPSSAWINANAREPELLRAEFLIHSDRMARDRATVRNELLNSEKKIWTLTRRLDAEHSRFRALSAELRATRIPDPDRPDEQIEANRRRTPEANMIDSVSRIVHRCRAAKITAEQARDVAILQLSTMASEKYRLTAVPQIVQDRVIYEVAQFWAAASRL